MVGNSLSNEDIEEIISDSFFILWKNRNKLDQSKKIEPYLAGIIRNLVKLKYRKMKFNNNIEDYSDKIIDFRAIDLIYEEREKVNIIEKALNKMKKQDIEIFNMYYYSAMKISEIAKVFNITEKMDLSAVIPTGNIQACILIVIVSAAVLKSAIGNRK